MKILIQSHCNGLQMRFKGFLWGLIQSYLPRKSSSLKTPRKYIETLVGLHFVFKKINLYPYLTLWPPASSSPRVQHQLPAFLHLTLLPPLFQNQSPLQSRKHFPTHPPPAASLHCIRLFWHSLDPTVEQSEVANNSCIGEDDQILKSPVLALAP